MVICKTSLTQCWLYFLQVIAFICGNIVIILLIMALASTDWLMSAGWRQGLFSHCIEDLVEPIPFNFDAKETGCYPSRDVCKYFIEFAISPPFSQNHISCSKTIDNRTVIRTFGLSYVVISPFWKEIKMLCLHWRVQLKRVAFTPFAYVVQSEHCNAFTITQNV